MNRFFFHLFFLCFFVCIPFLLPGTTPTILVTVAPHKFFVEQIAKNTVTVQLMVPAGASAHTFEPSPRQMMAAAKAAVWFRIGEPFENRAIQGLKSHCPSLEIVDLREGVDLIASGGEHAACCCCKGAVDLHFWLSAKQAQIQAKTIAEALSKAFPAYANFYRANAETFIQELEALDAKIRAILSCLKNRSIFVSHPAYAYFCRDFDLQQYAVEVEGKDPTPQQITKLLYTARRLEAKAIFIQMQYNNKAAKLVAEEIGAKLIVLDPYSEHYFSAMLEIAHAFAKQ